MLTKKGFRFQVLRMFLMFRIFRASSPKERVGVRLSCPLPLAPCPKKLEEAELQKVELN